VSDVSTIRYSESVPIDTSAAPGALLRDARRLAGLTQVELGRRAGVTQSVISAYESGARQPSLPTLARLVAATGWELALDVRKPAPAWSRLTGPLGRRVVQHRRALSRATAAHGASNLRVFGSVARGEDNEDSDVDLLVDLAPGSGLLGLAALERDLSQILQAKVDVVPASDLKLEVAREALIHAVPL
jgi:predicted nucleotidyltransferase/DNA-binding XRE family transcriptional regulator